MHTMDVRTLPLLVLFLTPMFIEAWVSLVKEQRNPREVRRDIHYHSKRHMLPSETEPRRRMTTVKPRDIRKKPSGHLIPLADDDMDNDEVVSVAVGPPPTRPKYEKLNRKSNPKPTYSTSNVTVTSMIKDIFTQLGREFLSRQVNEDFVFGQYVGNSLKNLTSDLRLSMQHDMLDLIVKYQKLNRGDVSRRTEERSTTHALKDIKMENKLVTNDTEETWPDFSNLDKIVG